MRTDKKRELKVWHDGVTDQQSILCLQFLLFKMEDRHFWLLFTLFPIYNQNFWYERNENRKVKEQGEMTYCQNL